MHRVDTDGNVSNLFDNGDPGEPRQPTLVDADILNAFQEEIVNAILDQGIALVKGTNTQLRSALRIWHGGTSDNVRTLVKTIGNSADTGAPRIRFYSTLHATNGEVTKLEIVIGCSWNGTNWVPDVSSNVCLKLSLNWTGIAIARFQASGTTPFSDGSFTNDFSTFGNVTTVKRLSATNPSGTSAAPLNATQSDSEHGHMAFNLLASPPSSPAKGEMYVDTNAVLWICTDAAGPTWVKVGTQS